MGNFNLGKTLIGVTAICVAVILCCFTSNNVPVKREAGLWRYGDT